MDEKEKKSLIQIGLVFFLMILDFVLTKIGITLGVIVEGNELMLWLIALPFFPGLLIKVILSVILLLPIYFAMKSGKKIFKVAIIILLIAFAITMLLHCAWILYFIFIL